jgi:hypothetical protein
MVEEEKKEYEINILYKNGANESIRVELDKKTLDNQLQVIGMCYKENQPGFLLLNGIFVKISETCQIETKEIPPLSTQK